MTLTEKLDQLEKLLSLEYERTIQLRIAQDLIKNSQPIQDYEATNNKIKKGKHPAFITDEQVFLTAIEEEPNASHAYLKQDPKTNLGGIVGWHGDHQDKILYLSPNSNYFDKEEFDIRQGISDQGITREFGNKGGRYDMNKSNDSTYSLLGSIGFLEIMARYGNDGKGFEWDDIRNESTGKKDQIQVDYENLLTSEKRTREADIQRLKGETEQELLNLNSNQSQASRFPSHFFPHPTTHSNLHPNIHGLILQFELRCLANKFSGERLGGRRIEINFYDDQQQMGNALGSTKGKIYPYVFHINILIGNRERGSIFYTLAHELAHTSIMLKEYKKLLPRFQDHSKAFGDANFEGHASTIMFVWNNLQHGGGDRRNLENFMNPLNERTNNGVARGAYFPDAEQDLVGKLRRRFVIPETRGTGNDYYFRVKQLGDYTRKVVLNIVNHSMSDPGVNGGFKDNNKGANNHEKKMRGVQVEVKQRAEGKGGHYKIYVYYNKNIPSDIRNLLNVYLPIKHNQGEEKEVSPEKFARRTAKRPHLNNKECGGREHMMTAQEIQDLQAQIQANPHGQ